jgi:S1-C subfamily serine protease
LASAKEFKVSDFSFLEGLSAALADLTAKAAPGVVAVHSHRALSSGFVWRPGLVVTSDEGLADEGAIEVILAGGVRRVAVVAGRDPTTDIALLRIEGETPAPLALDAPPVRAGALTLTVSANMAGAPIVALGAVAHVGPAWRSLRGGEIDGRIDLNVRLRREAEGGLVLDASGSGVGMAVFGPRRRVLVIPGATIGRVAARLETHGRIARGYLGLGLHRVRLDDGPETGIMVMGIDANGPGAAAGMRQGDVIVTWDGQKVAGVPSLVRAMGPDSVGRVVTLGIRRGGAPAEVRLTIGERSRA